jgi:mannose-6-phosphate isomerase-like protein (cupin superfamily)
MNRSGRIIELTELPWQAIRPELTREVFGKSLLSSELTAVKAVLTRVGPGGEFASHRDAYHHLLYFLAGEGEGWLGEERYAIHPGMAVEVPAGVEHGYRNSGEEDLLLLTLNVPV